MIQIKFVDHQGMTYLVEAEPGQSVMQVAVDNNIPSIIGECGGNCFCATCHAVVDDQHASNLAPAQEFEKETLDGVLDLQVNSRLCCQIQITEELNGVVFHLPASQM